MMEVTTLDLLVIGTYLLVMLGVGIWFVRGASRAQMTTT